MKVAVVFPKDSEALFNKNSKRTFGGASVQMYLIAKELKKRADVSASSLIPDYSEINFDDSGSFDLIKTFNEKDF